MSKEYTQVEAFNDFTGQTVRPGDEIVFPSRVGSSMWMNKAKVIKVEVHNWVAKTWRWENGERVPQDTPSQDWRISVQRPGHQRVSRLEAVERIVKVRSAKEIELAEREAEMRAFLSRPVFGFDGSGAGRQSHTNLITFGEAAYDA